MSDEDPSYLPDEPAWTCANCDVHLEPRSVDVAYLGSAFPVELAACPSCGLVLVPEDLALGRMLDVEQQLEDK
jgi:hypothetical protein